MHLELLHRGFRARGNIQLANALRRAIEAHVPIFAPHVVDVGINTSHQTNEELAQRISVIPLCDQHDPKKRLEYATVCMSLCAHCATPNRPQWVTTDDIRDYRGPPIPLVELAPEAAIQLTIRPRQGTCIEHACFSAIFGIRTWTLDPGLDTVEMTWESFHNTDWLVSEALMYLATSVESIRSQLKSEGPIVWRSPDIYTVPDLVASVCAGGYVEITPDQDTAIIHLEECVNPPGESITNLVTLLRSLIGPV